MKTRSKTKTSPDNISPSAQIEKRVDTLEKQVYLLQVVIRNHMGFSQDLADDLDDTMDKVFGGDEEQ